MSAALADTRVVAINGARQSGKSTLVQRVLRSVPGATARTLDRASDLLEARSDPEAFVRRDGLLAIDEVQRAPDLILAIKAEVDADPTPGRFLLTGSARLLGLRSLPDSLVGRMETIELWPFSQGEIDGRRERLVDVAFSDDGVEALRSLPPSATSRDEYVERVARGGFPGAVARAPGRRRVFFEQYVNDLIDRDVTQLAELRRRVDLRRLIELLAATAAQPLRIERLANAVGIAAGTVERYIALFEEVFLVKRLPAFAGSESKRATRLRKVMMVDSGLASALTGRNVSRLVRDGAAFGPLLENFVISELARQISFSDEPVRLSHFRTRDGVEVDAVLEHADGRVVGIEVKSEQTPRAEHAHGLRHLSDLLGDRFHGGLVLTMGSTVISLGGGIVTAPIDALWSGAPPS